MLHMVLASSYFTPPLLVLSLSLLSLITTLITSYANVAVFGFCYRVLTSQKKLASYVTEMYAPTARCFTFDCIVLVGRRLYSKAICPITLLSPRYRVRVWYCPTRKRYSLYIVLRILIGRLVKLTSVSNFCDILVHSPVLCLGNF